MRTILSLTVIGSTLAALTSALTWPQSSPAVGQSFRVFGQSPAAELVNNSWRSGDLKLEAPLPVDYVPPTPANNIEIKAYPSVRRAEFDREDLFFKSLWSTGRAFKKLFDHIKTRNIAMTSPIEMNYRKMTDRYGLLASDKGDWTMSFLYRSPSLGPVGNAEDDVRVVDRKEVTVIALGFTGDYSYQQYNDGL